MRSDNHGNCKKEDLLLYAVTDRSWLNGETLYAIYALPEGEQLPACMEWKGNVPTGKMTLLKGNKRLKYTVEGEQVKVFLPEGLQNEPVVVQFRKTSK